MLEVASDNATGSNAALTDQPGDMERPWLHAGSFIWMPEMAWRLLDCIARVPGTAPAA